MKIPFNIWNRKKQKGKGEDPDAVRVLNEDNSVSITVTIGDVDYTVNNLKPKSTPSQEESAKEKRALRYKRADKRERKLIIWRVLRYMITYRDLSSSSNFYEYKNNIASHNQAVEELKSSNPDVYHLEAAIRFCQLEFLAGRCDYELTDEDIDALRNWETKPIDLQKVLRDVLAAYKEYWNDVLKSYTSAAARKKRLEYLINNLDEIMTLPGLHDSPAILKEAEALQSQYKSQLNDMVQ